MSPRAEWVNAHRFAEIAEALGVATTCIMAATGVEDGALVLYSTGVDEPLEEHEVCRALLERDGDGILRVTRHHRIGTLGKWMAWMDEEIGPILQRKLGPPEST